MPVRLASTVSRFIAAGVVFLIIATSGPASAETLPQAGADRTPNPARQPTFHPSQSSGVVMGALRIPAIGVDEVIRSGVAIEIIDQGVAHWAGTASPGHWGNVVLAGHRSTHSRPFWSLGDLEVGDLVFVEDGFGFEVMYRVTDSYIVDPKAIWISYDRDRPELTMFACHPKGSNRYRIVVSADLVAGGRIA
ncbi:MAG: class E sortase [Acidimicrobiia bacterium]|nr:class E sortase [Acidimicrobiia bacterium]